MLMGRGRAGGVRYVSQPGSDVPVKNRGEGLHTAAWGCLQRAGHHTKSLTVFSCSVKINDDCELLPCAGNLRIIPVYYNVGLTFVVSTIIFISNNKF